jgi:hypothetical protein
MFKDASLDVVKDTPMPSITLANIQDPSMDG